MDIRSRHFVKATRRQSYRHFVDSGPHGAERTSKTCHSSQLLKPHDARARPRVRPPKFELGLRTAKGLVQASQRFSQEGPRRHLGSWFGFDREFAWHGFESV